MPESPARGKGRWLRAISPGRNHQTGVAGLSQHAGYPAKRYFLPFFEEHWEMVMSVTRSLGSKLGVSPWLIAFLALEGLLLYGGDVALAKNLALTVAVVWLWYQVANA